ncbi:HAD family hydrolase [Dinoroseobacter sp. S375]|uniref:HAD family hydrolase n=1 Tax=Dinoroseobacter sp. S375 TaxID=3415136 RepID=UPI003C7E4B5D
MSATEIVFDIGGVLVDWDPHLAWIEDLGSRDAVAEFIARTDFMARNTRADGGASFADLAAEIADPTDRALFAKYVARYGRTVPEVIPGTWDLLDRLAAKGHGIHAITNWSAETWPEGVRAHPRLGEVFDTLIVSGVERLLKPGPEIFALFCHRAGVAARACLFIDNTYENVAGARAAGMDAVHFTTPEALEADLVAQGLL